MRTHFSVATRYWDFFAIRIPYHTHQKYQFRHNFYLFFSPPYLTQQHNKTITWYLCKIESGIRFNQLNVLPKNGFFALFLVFVHFAPKTTNFTYDSQCNFFFLLFSGKLIAHIQAKIRFDWAKRVQTLQKHSRDYEFFFSLFNEMQCSFLSFSLFFVVVMLRLSFKVNKL